MMDSRLNSSAGPRWLRAIVRDRVVIGAGVTLVSLLLLMLMVWETRPQIDTKVPFNRTTAEVATGEPYGWWFAGPLGVASHVESWRRWIREAYDGEVPSYGKAMTAAELPADMIAGMADIEATIGRLLKALLEGALAFWLVVAIFTKVDYMKVIRRVKVMPSPVTLALALGAALVLAALAPIIVLNHGLGGLFFSLPLFLGVLAASFLPRRKVISPTTEPMR